MEEKLKKKISEFVKSFIEAEMTSEETELGQFLNELGDQNNIHIEEFEFELTVTNVTIDKE